MKFTTRDLINCLITGLTAGVIGWLVLAWLGVAPIADVGWSFLPLIIPVFWVAGVWLGYWLGQYVGLFAPFGKFVAIGFTNFAVDAGVLNWLIYSTGIVTGDWLVGFKVIAFLTANAHSYFWNRRWAFQSRGALGREGLLFVVVSLLALLVNAGTFKLFVDYIPPAVGFDPIAWANVATVAGSAVALLSSFIGFRLVVFKRG